MSRVSKGGKELALKIKREECGEPRMREQIKPRSVLECRNGKLTLIVLPSQTAVLPERN